MQAHRPLFPARVRVGDSAGGARHARPAMSIRSHAMRGVLVLALALSFLAALALSAHGSARPGHHHAVVAGHSVPTHWMW
jgi:hypothetical protein